MTDRPIIFSAPMVRALLDGRKTQTRRILKQQYGDLDQPIMRDDGSWHVTDRQGGHMSPWPVRWRVGDRLWVRETFATGNPEHYWGSPIYRATFSAMLKPVCEGFSEWKPSIHMPRAASRITLTVTDVRVQRLQDISEEDAEHEGFGGDYPSRVMPSIFTPPEERWENLTLPECFGVLWDHINGEGAWNQNPWVAAISFDVTKQNIDRMTA